MSTISIIDSARDLVGMIRQYSESQKYVWRVVPNLALEADGRSGFNGRYERAYRQGYWAIESSKGERGYAVFVDLATGELIDATTVTGFVIRDVVIPPKGRPKPARDEDILKIAFRLDDLDAGRVVKQLGIAISEYYSNPDMLKSQQRWRAGVREELGLEAVFTRE